MTRTGLRSLWIVLTVFVGVAASLAGCASVGSVGPLEVSDIKDVAGAWKGVVYQSSQFSPDYVTLTIREDGSYDVVSARQPIGTSRGQGKVTLREGRLVFEGPRGSGMGRVQRNADGSVTMLVDGTLSDNSTLSAQLSRSN
jgi:hypothetical protein